MKKMILLATLMLISAHAQAYATQAVLECKTLQGQKLELLLKHMQGPKAIVDGETASVNSMGDPGGRIGSRLRSLYGSGEEYRIATSHSNFGIIVNVNTGNMAEGHRVFQSLNTVAVEFQRLVCVVVDVQ